MPLFKEYDKSNKILICICCKTLYIAYFIYIVYKKNIIIEIIIGYRSTLL